MRYKYGKGRRNKKQNRKVKKTNQNHGDHKPTKKYKTHMV